jgi:hypothetical protein
VQNVIKSQYEQVRFPGRRIRGRGSTKLVFRVIGRRGPDRMMRSCFRVSPKGTDVMGMVAAQGLPLGRCLGVAESSLSLSLSLSTPGLLGKKPSFGVRRGAFHHLSAGIRRAPVRGIPRSRLAGRGACSNATTPSPVAFEEAPARAPSRAGVVSAERRGPDSGPRRSSIFFSRPLGASSHNNRGAFVPSDSQEER